MPQHDVRAYLFDIAEACRLITEFTSGKTLDDYRRDAMVRSAVERQFEIIGEALRQLTERNPELSARISGVAMIIAFRNRLIHGYATVSDDVVWGVIESHLPVLSREVSGLLQESGAEE
jgi:uncharacterized protein with HEPN domain